MICYSDLESWEGIKDVEFGEVESCVVIYAVGVAKDNEIKMAAAAATAGCDACKVM